MVLLPHSYYLIYAIKRVKKLVNEKPPPKKAFQLGLQIIISESKSEKSQNLTKCFCGFCSGFLLSLFSYDVTSRFLTVNYEASTHFDGSVSKSL